MTTDILATDDCLTIRNLTNNAISLERYEIHDRQKRAHSSSFAKNVTSVFVSAKSSPLVHNVSTKVEQTIVPSQTSRVAVKRAELPDQILCLCFVLDGISYQANIIHAKCHSQYLMAADGNTDPPHKHITIYHPGHHHLTIAYRSSYKSWMKPLRDDILLSALSIPGTHNSPTYHKALPSVRCQVVPVREQLRRGVRFLDIRVQPEHHKLPLRDEMILVHGAFPISFTGPRHFKTLVTEVLDFLKVNPSECVIMSVKREGTGPSSDENLSRILRDHYAGNVDEWFTAPRVPYLGEARGKIVLIRRFNLDDSLNNEWGGAGWAIDGGNWADNTPNALCPSGDICVQDFYEVLQSENIELKIKYAIEHLKRAGECIQHEDAAVKQPFYINFLTGSNFWKMGCWPEKVAAKLNPAIIEYLCLKHNDSEDRECARGDGSTGIVVCDWVGYQGDWDLVRCIVGMNARFEKTKAS